MHEELTALVDATLVGEHEFESTWRRVGRAIDEQPSSRSLRKLRLRLARAADLRAELLADLRVLCKLEPRDRKAVLELALVEFAWGSDEADADASQPSARLAQLLGLLHQIGNDAARLDWALTTWDASKAWQPWWRLQIALHAAALHPRDARLARHVALAYAQLVQHPPAIDSADGQPPPGFALDATGALCDPLMAARALAALDAALAAAPEDAELLFNRALVHQGLGRFVAAEMDFAGAGRAWDRSADRSGASVDESARDRVFADRAFAMAQRCSGGRETLSRPWLPDSGGGPHSPGTLFSMPTMPGIPTRRDPRAAASGDSAEQTQARLAGLARRTAEQLAPLLDAPAGSWREVPAPPGEAAAPRWLPPAMAMEAAGLLPLAWAEYSTLHDAQGRPLPCRVWCSRDGAVSVVAVAQGDAVGIEVGTGFDDGRFVTTTNARGRTFLAGGERVDCLHADDTLHLDLLLALHRARVALRRAGDGSVQPRAVRSFADFSAAQERQRAAEAAHREACGLDAFEALAVPAELPELFAPLLQAAALAVLRERRAKAKR